MSDLVHLVEKPLAHHLQGTNFSRVFLLRQVHLSISTLADLSQDVEVAMVQSCPSLAQICTFSAEVFTLCCLVLGVIACCRLRVLRLELRLAGLTIMNIA